MSKICGCYDTSVCDRFEQEIEGHEMKVLMKQKGYLHMMCKKPDSSSYWFEIIVAPRSLTFRGDGESFSFHACDDMMGFFRNGWYHNKIHINTTYWAEKVTSNRDGLKKYDEDEFKKVVLSYVDDYREEQYPGLTADLEMAIDEEREDWCSELQHEEGARRFLEDYTGPGGFKFSDVWEMDFRTYDWWFLWALHAIVWAVKEHDKVYGVPGKVQDLSQGTDITASLV